MTRKMTITAALFTAALITPVAMAGPLNVSLEDISKLQGEIKIGVYDAEGYESGKALTGASVTVDEVTETVTIDGLEPGEYGLKLYHDVDGDGEMNTNPFGMPTEPFAFSNNAKGRFGPATWDAAKFTVSAEGATQTISIN